MQEINISVNETRLIPENEQESMQNYYGIHAKYYTIFKNPNRIGITNYIIW